MVMREVVASLTRGERREGKKLNYHFPHSVPIFHAEVAFKSFSLNFESDS
jgi:hypothetical protein